MRRVPTEYRATQDDRAALAVNAATWGLAQKLEARARHEWCHRGACL
jgi:hypothetical protein